MAARVNLLIDQGATFSQEFQLFDDNGDPLMVTHANGVPIYTHAATMKKSYQAINSVPFTTSLSNGSLILSLPATVSSNMAAGRYVWDAELTNEDAGAVVRVIEGIVTIKPEVT